MDEASKQLLRDEQPGQPPAPGRPAREDYHYERRGTQAIFMFFDPLAGWRRVACRDSRTRVDWAEEVRRLLDEDYPHAQEGQAGVRQSQHARHRAASTRRFRPRRPIAWRSDWRSTTRRAAAVG